MTYLKDVKMQDIYFTVKPQSVNNILTKYIHPSQDEVNPETDKVLKAMYPSLKDCKFFFISCRPNIELYALFASYRDSIIVVEPENVRNTLVSYLADAVSNYDGLG